MTCMNQYFHFLGSVFSFNHNQIFQCQSLRNPSLLNNSSDLASPSHSTKINIKTSFASIRLSSCAPLYYNSITTFCCGDYISIYTSHRHSFTFSAFKKLSILHEVLVQTQFYALLNPFA